MKKTVTLLVFALTLSLSAAVWAGGEQCDHAAHAKTASAAHAAHGWLGIETDKFSSGTGTLTGLEMAG